MNRVFIALAASLLAFSVSEAGESSMNPRTLALMSSLGVAPASKQRLPDRDQGALSAHNLKRIGSLLVQHRTLDEKEDDVHFILDRLSFSDESGKSEAWGDVKYAESANAAQKLLFDRLAGGTLPLEVLLKSYEIKANGPGDICIVGSIRDGAAGQVIVNRTHIHFMRGNVVVSIFTKDTGVNITQIAMEMDKLLVGETVDK